MQLAHDADLQGRWDSIGADFFETAKSVRAIAREHGLSETAIRKMAKKRGWIRPELPAPNRSGYALTRALTACLLMERDQAERDRKFVQAMVALGASSDAARDAMG